jgi:hypothetical protein
MKRLLAWIGVCVLIPIAASVAAQDDGRPPNDQRAEARLQDEAAARDLSRRQELVATVLSVRETASGRRFGGDLRSRLAGLLLRVPTATVETFQQAGGLGDIEALVRDANPQALGDPNADLVFTPVTPCRIINTTAAGGQIPANQQRTFFVNGSTAGTFETQGGTAGGCGIPDDATSVEMNFIAVGPTAAGDFRAFPFGLTAPLASVINYASLPGLNIANGIAQPVCNAATTTCTFDLTVQADAAASHLIVDVVGYFRAVNKAQVKSFINTSSPVATIYAATCTNAGANQITLVAPVAGKIVARMTGSFAVNHVTGTTSILIMALGTTATDCSAGDQFIRIEASWPTAAVTALPVALTRILNVAAGSSTTFYLNGQINGGTGHRLTTAGGNLMEATFIPN